MDGRRRSCCIRNACRRVSETTTECGRAHRRRRPATVGQQTVRTILPFLLLCTVCLSVPSSAVAESPSSAPTVLPTSTVSVSVSNNSNSNSNSNSSNVPTGAPSPSTAPSFVSSSPAIGNIFISPGNGSPMPTSTTTLTSPAAKPDPDTAQDSRQTTPEPVSPERTVAPTPVSTERTVAPTPVSTERQLNITQPDDHNNANNDLSAGANDTAAPSFTNIFENADTKAPSATPTLTPSPTPVGCCSRNYRDCDVDSCGTTQQQCTACSDRTVLWLQNGALPSNSCIPRFGNCALNINGCCGSGRAGCFFRGVERFCLFPTDIVRTNSPTVSASPTISPSSNYSQTPSENPSTSPSSQPSAAPSVLPSRSPTSPPTIQPSHFPSNQPVTITPSPTELGGTELRSNQDDNDNDSPSLGLIVAVAAMVALLVMLCCVFCCLIFPDLFGCNRYTYYTPDTPPSDIEQGTTKQRLLDDFEDEPSSEFSNTQSDELNASMPDLFGKYSATKLDVIDEVSVEDDTDGCNQKRHTEPMDDTLGPIYEASDDDDDDDDNTYSWGTHASDDRNDAVDPMGEKFEDEPSEESVEEVYNDYKTRNAPDPSQRIMSDTKAPSSTYSLDTVDDAPDPSERLLSGTKPPVSSYSIKMEGLYEDADGDGFMKVEYVEDDDSAERASSNDTMTEELDRTANNPITDVTTVDDRLENVAIGIPVESAGSLPRPENAVDDDDDSDTALDSLAAAVKKLQETMAHVPDVGSRPVPVSPRRSTASGHSFAASDDNLDKAVRSTINKSTITEKADPLNSASNPTFDGIDVVSSGDDESTVREEVDALALMIESEKKSYIRKRLAESKQVNAGGRGQKTKDRPAVSSSLADRVKAWESKIDTVAKQIDDDSGKPNNPARPPKKQVSSLSQRLPWLRSDNENRRPSQNPPISLTKKPASESAKNHPAWKSEIRKDKGAEEAQKLEPETGLEQQSEHEPTVEPPTVTNKLNNLAARIQALSDIVDSEHSHQRSPRSASKEKAEGGIDRTNKSDPDDLCPSSKAKTGNSIETDEPKAGFWSLDTPLMMGDTGTDTEGASPAVSVNVVGGDAETVKGDRSQSAASETISPKSATTNLLDQSTKHSDAGSKNSAETPPTSAKSLQSTADDSFFGNCTALDEEDDFVRQMAADDDWSSGSSSIEDYDFSSA